MSGSPRFQRRHPGKASRALWLRPDVRKLNAGAAEQGGSTHTDLLANQS
jgi:hypothetical protein